MSINREIHTEYFYKGSNIETLFGNITGEIGFKTFKDPSEILLVDNLANLPEGVILSIKV